MSPISHNKALSIAVRLRYRKSTAQVAKIVGVPQSTVKRYRQKYIISFSVSGDFAVKTSAIHTLLKASGLTVI
ncbi:hypothetical protein PHYBLDRAFT_147373 [Phycomyces blakesleeanus NRRL 1555(-)]|uniref:Homeodomain-like DNA binding domain-containing transcription factor n=1 Tax=Phycomyces blakesleeanus (strain ATCC 8743b / DSM 1359 / FGSC 10004 / NBRC 33097 / NRRL 1555) TaxID=763407 RepID=A0A167M306_PHYB8|nr:hypothetical protein PHYBLDRAFT_147373 [Phycomyces blakesleeanus NRRL 1555(-)]OAD71624.1 hypothetical protein PHYBLDRAFT_147373 [Phycomyces blakesleeanus NRRL 1555(-)]|eukprot:XP_018289664.1 hypothetical protein PHYBLDRAFT_147373 [Phycomyces blakesleeanus NRRL 1555(-)]